MLISRRALIAGAGGAVLAGPRAFAAAEPVKGGTLIAIIQPEPSVLTSALNSAFSQGVVSTNVFDGLVRFDENLELQPSLALKWTHSEDSLSITFDLRRNVKWHDGKPFTSADVAFSIMEILKKFSPRGRLNYASVEAVDTPDPHTAIFRLSKPAPVVLNALTAAEGQMLPRHLYEGTDISKNPHNNKPIGTGPFRFKEWRRGEYISLEKNPDYWESGKPYVDALIFRIIPDAGARAAALETGAVQYAPYDPLPFSDVERIKAMPGLAVSTYGYDYQSQVLSIEFNLRNKYVSDVRVRRAIGHAIDMQKLTETVWYGIGKPAINVVPSTLPKFHTSDVPKYPFDMAKANALLDEAGFPRQADGVRFTLNHSYMVFHEAFRRNAEFVRQSLKDVGINTVIDNSDLPGYLRKVYTRYDYDMNSGQFSTFIDPEMGLTRFLWSKAIQAGVVWTNASGYASPEMDQIIEAQKYEPRNERRVELLKQLQKVAMTDLPFLPLMEMQHVTVYSKRLHGLSKSPDAALSSLKDVWLEKV